MDIYAVARTAVTVMSAIHFFTNPPYMCHVPHLPCYTFYPDIARNVLSSAALVLAFKGLTLLYLPNSRLMLIPCIGAPLRLLIACNKEQRAMLREIALSFMKGRKNHMSGTKKPRVLFIDFSYPDNSYSLELSRCLKEYCDITVFCQPGGAEDEPGVTLYPGFHRGVKSKIGTVLNYADSLLKLKRTLRKGNFDVVHAQFFKKPAVEIPMLLKAKGQYKRLVATVHNVLPHESSAQAADLYNSLYQASDGLIVHNETSRAALLERFPHIDEKKIRVTAHGAYGGYDVSLAKRDGDPRKHFLMFGSIRKYKGIDLLLEAVARLPEEARKKSLFIIKGQQFQAMDATDYRGMIRDLGIADCVDFSSERVEDKDVPALLGNADAGVFPYRHIYGSGALLMNYTFGVPVIVSDIPAFREETNGGETGLLFQPENPEALRDAILKCLSWDEAQIRSYQNAIRRLVAEKYSWPVSARKIADMYAAVLK